jgi:hypothetical protein
MRQGRAGSGPEELRSWSLFRLGPVDGRVRRVSSPCSSTNVQNATRGIRCEIHRGQLLLRQGHSEAPEKLFRKALSIAREQEAKLWELRAAASLARLWRGQGRPAEARDLLAPVYGWFTEGFDTPDLKEAKALLRSSGILFDFATLKRKSRWSTPVSPAPPQVALPQPPCIAAR